MFYAEKMQQVSPTYEEWNKFSHCDLAVQSWIKPHVSLTKNSWIILLHWSDDVEIKHWKECRYCFLYSLDFASLNGFTKTDKSFHYKAITTGLKKP